MPGNLEITLTVTEPTRLDHALLEHLRAGVAPGLSRAQLKSFFHEERVRLQGRPAVASALLPPGPHAVSLLGFDDSTFAAPRAAAASECFLSVVYEDDALLVLNKASGTPSVPQENDETETAVGAALARRPELAGVGRPGYEPAILHRLDTGTSGLIVFARTSAEFERLQALWRAGGVRKTYRAIARPAGDAELPRLPSLIDTPLAHDASKAKRMLAVKPDTRPGLMRGSPLPARTRLLSARTLANSLHDFELEIETGVMHQIRVHLASIGWPIQGDPVYKGVPASRLWLHAWKLEIPLASGTRLRLQAALPDGWPSSRTAPGTE